MDGIATKLATSTLIVALAMTGSAGPSEAMRRGMDVSQATSQSDRQAADFAAQGARALQQGQLSAALTAMEQAVALSPRDAGYRLTLADLYLKSGRFESARTTYADVLELDPDRVRAGLGYALTQIALGHPRAAVTQLDIFADRGSAADIGLAYALAGETAKAIRMLEPAARATGADARTRQNLALAYALAGDWRRARAVAAQDISPRDLPARMEQWAAMARPDSGQTRVAGLLGVSPVADSGQPVRLALNTDPQVRTAAADPMPAAPAPVVTQAPAAPVALASADPVPAPAAADPDWGAAPSAQPTQVAEAAPAEAPTYYTPAPAPRPVESPAQVRYAAAAATLDRPAPHLVRAVQTTLPPAPIFRRANPAAPVRAGNSPYVVQLGAFSNEANAERAWLGVARRYGLSGRAPLTTTIQVNGRTMHRVSIAGFAGQGDAARLCGAIRSQGGACFVRTNAGDASIRWAARYAPNARRQRDV